MHVVMLQDKACDVQLQQLQVCTRSTTHVAHSPTNAKIVTWLQGYIVRDVFAILQAGTAPQQQQPAAATAAAVQPQQQLSGTKRPAASLAGSSGSRGADGAAAADAAVPKGFFDDKTADKKARGIKE
jgi:hypothetical protein